MCCESRWVSGWTRAPQIGDDGIARLAILILWSESVVPWLVCLSLPARRVEQGCALFRLDTALRSGEDWACHCLTCLPACLPGWLALSRRCAPDMRPRHDCKPRLNHDSHAHPCQVYCDLTSGLLSQINASDLPKIGELERLHETWAAHPCPLCPRRGLLVHARVHEYMEDVWADWNPQLSRSPKAL